MNSRKVGWFVVLGLAALVLSAAVPDAVRAAWLGYRNDTKAPVIVQASSIQRNVVRRGAPHLLYARDTAWDAVLQPGPRVITIYDGNDPKRVLCQGTVVSGAAELFLLIEVEMPPKPAKGQPPAPPRYRIRAVPPPTPPPGMRR